MSQCTTDVLKIRTGLSDEIRQVVSLVTSEPNIVPVGTFRYEIFKYPGDIDIFEHLEACCEFSTSKLTAAEKIQNIVRKVMGDNKIIFNEFKAGYDLRFKIYTGSVNSHIEDYNPGLIRRDITNLYEANLLTCTEYSHLTSMIKDDPEVEQIIELNDELRKYWVIRWTEEDIIKGYKMLRGNYKLYLDVAISQGTIVKLDTIAYVEGRFVEVTNFFLISMLDKFGSQTIISQELKDYEQSLVLDVYKYYNSNPLKSIKRLWMYLAYNKKICDLYVFASLFKGDISLQSQILADVTTALLLLSPDLCPKFIEIYGSYDILFESLNKRVKQLSWLCEPKPYYANTHEVVEDLIRIQTCLREHINKLTHEWLETHNLNIFSFIQPGDVTQSAILANESNS